MPRRTSKATMRSLLAVTSSERFEKLGKAYAQANGYSSAAGGWIYKNGKPVEQGWSSFAHLKHMAILNWVVQEISGCSDFNDLLNAMGGYRPTLRADLDWRVVPLAEEYDVAQAKRGDPRRAYTPGFTVELKARDGFYFTSVKLSE